MKILIRDVLHDKARTDVFIDNGRITEISPGITLEADKTINGSDKAILPAMINGHTHAAMTLFRGYADDMPLKPWLEEKIWPLEAKLTEEDVYWGTKLACLEMIKNGITAFSDMYWHWEATAKAVCDMKMRGFISAVFIDMFDEKKGQEQIEHNIMLFEIARRYKPYVTFTLGPHAIYTVSKKSIEWIRDFSEKENVLIHMHLAETQEETKFSLEKYGVTPVEFLHINGVLSERYIGCHGCMLNDLDCKFLKSRNAKLVHMPVSNMKLSVGRVFPHFLMLNEGIPFCFGTDGCASNNHLDIIETMKFASLMAKFFSHDPTLMPAKDTYNTATETAAQIFSLPDWRIEVGKSPDVILIDLARPEMTPCHDIYSNIVYAGNGSAVDTVICMGEVLMENRRVPGEEEIIKNATKIARSLTVR